MSYYFNYYAGYFDKKTNKIYPLGPYSSKHVHIRPILSVSSSFASDLHEDFALITDPEQISIELREEFEWGGIDGEKVFQVKSLPFSKLPKGSFISKGYFLMEDVERYEQSGDEENSWDLFYDKLSPIVYAAKVQSEMMFGQKAPTLDAEGEPLTEHSASDYMYYAYPDYDCKEYEAFVIRLGMSMLDPLYFIPEDDNRTLLVLETEG